MTMSYSSGQATLSRLRAHYARLLFFMAAPYPSGQVVQARPKAFYTQLLFLKQCHVHLARLRVDQTMKISCLVVIFYGNAMSIRPSYMLVKL